MNSKTIIYLLIVLVGVGVVYYMSTKVIPKVLVSMTQAAPAQTVSLSSSLIIGEKVMAKADGQEKVKVNVFVMDESGKGVSGKNVELTGGLQGLPMSGQSADEGKATFEVASTNKGQIKLGANIEGVELGKYVTVTFN
jgi:hypothetical protein